MSSSTTRSSAEHSPDNRDAAPLPEFPRRFLVALDNSEYAGRALAEAIRLVDPADGVITGIHAYAAALHDRRFRQMEGGLPDRYREEKEMERQRDVHDDLITRGLNIISDSYHDIGSGRCSEAGVEYRRLSPEGKNYRRIVDALGNGDFDVLALGALGLGAVPGSVIGTVCERVARRNPVDTLVIRDPGRAIGEGPIVVGIDGSERSYGALLTAFAIGRRVGAEVHAIAAYDPYYHYVAFNRIAGVLSEEAGKVFRFKEQEKLHEELIDEGIAKIYRSHLEVAKRLAMEEHGIALTCELLAGKPFRAILRYLEEVGASLLAIGKIGIHADDGLDIGGNAENLLRLAPCHVWLGQVAYAPSSDVVAEETITWSEEAEGVLGRAPEFARGMARTAVIRYAQEKGHTFITSAMVEEVANRLMPGRHAAADSTVSEPLGWSAEADVLVAAVADPSVASNIRLRAEKMARREGAGEVATVHVREFLDTAARSTPDWAAAALARLSRVPEPMQAPTRARIETLARERGETEITLEIVEAGLAEARKAMHQAMLNGGHTRTVDDKE